MNLIQHMVRAEFSSDPGIQYALYTSPNYKRLQGAVQEE